MDKNEIVRYCSTCGSVIYSGSRECTNCGKRYADKKKTAFSIIKLSLISLSLFVVCYAVSNYLNAINAKNNQNFVEARRYYDNLLIPDKLFPDDYSFVLAGVLMEQNAHIEALEAFEALGDYQGCDAFVRFLKETIYERGFDSYNSGDYSLAQKYFESVRGYRRSDDYLFLVQCHLQDADKLNAPELTRLLSLLDFSDTTGIVLETTYTALAFLDGSWKNGDLYLVVDRSIGDNPVTYNLPHDGTQEHISVESGDYCTYISVDEDTPLSDWLKSRRKHFHIQIIDYDTIQVYCYSDNSTHVLYRQ